MSVLQDFERVRYISLIILLKKIITLENVPGLSITFTNTKKTSWINEY